MQQIAAYYKPTSGFPFLEPFSEKLGMFLKREGAMLECNKPKRVAKSTDV